MFNTLLRSVGFLLFLLKRKKEIQYLRPLSNGLNIFQQGRVQFCGTMSNEVAKRIQRCCWHVRTKDESTSSSIIQQGGQTRLAYWMQVVKRLQRCCWHLRENDGSTSSSIIQQGGQTCSTSWIQCWTVLNGNAKPVCLRWKLKRTRRIWSLLQGLSTGTPSSLWEERIY